MRKIIYISGVCLLLFSSCSTKRNTFFTRNYHQLTTRYNVNFNGEQAFKSGIKNMETRHKEDYTNLLPVFISNNDQTRSMSVTDMNYAIEKAAKAIDKHSITAKPRRRKNKDSKHYLRFRQKKEFNNQLYKSYLLLGKAYFYKKEYTLANNTLRFVQRQYAEDEKIMNEADIWLLRNLIETGREDEATKLMAELDGQDLNRKQRELVAAIRADYYVRQGMYKEAIPEMEKLVNYTKKIKRKPRYNYILSQLYIKENQDASALLALKKVTGFNFNYEMVFNAKINMALAYQGGDSAIKKKLNKMLKNSNNADFRDRIYYALASIEEKEGNEAAAIDLYWKSARSSGGNDNQQALSFFKLGDYYFKERNYVQAQSCYDSCMLLIDSRYEDYEKLRTLVTDLTELVTNLNIIQEQDSLQKLAVMPVAERNIIIDAKIQAIKDREDEEKTLMQREQTERSFYERNMTNRNTSGSRNTGSSGEWYFYNPVTVSLGKNDFAKKWGRRKLEDNWRRQNKILVDNSRRNDEIAEELMDEQGKPQITDVKSRDFYLKDLPLTNEAIAVSDKKIAGAYYKAGELYLYRFDDAEKALESFDAYIKRFPQDKNLAVVYYLAYEAADKSGNSQRAIQYRNDLITLFPDNDYAKGLQDSQYFRKVDDELKAVEKMYEQAYSYYAQVYYTEALNICDDILKRYPNNKMKANVLFLRAMCIINTGSPEEGKQALEHVITAQPNQEILSVVNGILASLSVGEQPVAYSDSEMARARYLQSNRNWRFDEDVRAGITEREQTTYKIDKDGEQVIVIILPDDLSSLRQKNFQARLMFLNTSEVIDGKKYEVKKEELWNKQEALIVSGIKNYMEANAYFNHIAKDKHLLKIIGVLDYRMFVTTPNNLAVLKRMRNVDDYVDFFAENYFDNRMQGEHLSGKWGAAVHAFNYEENKRHDFVLMVPFRMGNTRRFAETLRTIDPSLSFGREQYNANYEMIIVKNLGSKTSAMEYMDKALNDKSVFDLLAGKEYYAFIITEDNRKALKENEYIEEYMKFFNDNYLKSVGEVGVEDGLFVYNKGIPHKFVLFYSSTIDYLKLKAAFEAFNFAGLILDNFEYDTEHNYVVVSGFSNKDDAMRYFNRVMTDRRVFKPLRNTEYTNFIITDFNLNILTAEKSVNKYLDFFKKYYLND